jgi:hypothetical protein
MSKEYRNIYKYNERFTLKSCKFQWDNEHLKTFYDAFGVEFYIKIYIAYAMQNNIPILYIFLKLIVNL